MNFLIPIIASAQSNAPSGIKSLVFRVNEFVLNPLIKLGFVIALAYFIWGLVQYIRDRESGRVWDSSVFDKDGEYKKKGADQIIWGLIGLFIMVSVFGIMKVLTELTGSTIQTP